MFAAAALGSDQTSAEPQPAAQQGPVDCPSCLPSEGAWTSQAGYALLAYIERIGAEGLDPSDYSPTVLAAAIAANNPAVLDHAASERFNAIARDLAHGRIGDKAKRGWYIEDDKIDDEELRQLEAGALASGRISQALDGLLPTHPQYAALRAALAAAGSLDGNRARRIRLNMDRWRWLPRELGDKYIIVNVPAYHATLVEHGKVRWKSRAIVGAVHTPTPQLSVMATGVVLNPWWEVPPSLAGEVSSKPGYEPLMGEDGRILRWRQPPGAGNALGQMKFVMYNQHNIYLHDTNARHRFRAKGRALSHGCIRTENIADLAAELLSDNGGRWTNASLNRELATGQTSHAQFVKPVPVYTVYFSMAATNDGRIVEYRDIYQRDSRALEAMKDQQLAGQRA